MVPKSKPRKGAKAKVARERVATRERENARRAREWSQYRAELAQSLPPSVSLAPDRGAPGVLDFVVDDGMS